MKGKLNPPLKIGDRIVCYHMEGETSVSAGTEGTVKNIVRDPFEKDGQLIEVQWDNGSSLSLVSSVDAWKKIESDTINEQMDPDWEFVITNEDLFLNFDYQWFREFLMKMRNSGIINMLGAAPLIYAGKTHIDRYYGEGREDDDVFQEFLEDCDVARIKLVQGVMRYMENEGLDIDDLDVVNSFARKFSKLLLSWYMLSFG